jgi:hypothetical protein
LENANELPHPPLGGFFVREHNLFAVKDGRYTVKAVA